MTFYSAEVLIALEFLHTEQIVYRDLKPDNIMLDFEGHVKLIDFGFAKRIQRGFTYTNLGTIGYAAPEVVKGQQGYSFSVDIWSYGIVIVELLTG